MIKNLIFDFGGVLVDYNSHRIFDKYFGDYSKAQFFRDNVILKDLVKHLDIGEPFNECIEKAKIKYPEYAEPISIYSSNYYDMDGGEIPGMYELLETLTNEGFQIYGLSNWSYKVYKIIKRHHIFSLLKDYVISSEVHLLKPDPRIYTLALEKFSIRPEESLFVDDKESNVEGAKAVGMQATVFTNADELSSFIKETKDK